MQVPPQPLPVCGGQVVDMPDVRLRLLIKLLHQNHGRLSKAKRGEYAELTDQEIDRIEATVQQIFEP